MIVDSTSIYLNFVLYALYGKLSEADSLVRRFRPEIETTADELARMFPLDGSAPIYRGIMIEPGVASEHERINTFASWSEDLDVACWFASPASMISAPLAKHNPRLRGHLLMSKLGDARVLFHHAWAPRLFDRNVVWLAIQHPLIGLEGIRQIGWSLRTQREVITLPMNQLTPTPVDVPDVARLDEKLAPPWALNEAT